MVTSFDIGSEADPCPKVGEMLLALTAGQGLRGKLLARLRRCIARTAIKPVSSLPLSSEWPEMAALIRLDLPLSFDSRPHFYLPETLHIAISLCGAGPLAVRRSVHSFVVNTVHALAKDAESKTEILHKALVALGGSEGRSLFGIPGDSTATLPEWDVLKSGERLISILMEVVEAAAPSLGAFDALPLTWTAADL